MPANYSIDESAYWEDSYDHVDGVRWKVFKMGSLPIEHSHVMVLDMEPGFVIERHMHNTERFEVIVRGSLIVGDRVYGPGDVMMASPGELYGPKVCGPDGCTTVEFFAGMQEGEFTVFELEDGSLATRAADRSLPGQVAQAEWIEEQRARVLHPDASTNAHR